jgi:hypothetical protein
MLALRTNPKIGLFFSFSKFLKLLVLFYTGLLPFLGLRETHLELPMLSVFMSEHFSHGKRNNEGSEHFCCLLCIFMTYLFLESSRISFGKLPRLVLLVFDALLMRPALFEHLRFVKYHIMVLPVLIQIDISFDN